MFDINSKVTLNNGVEMPILGLGTYNMKGKAVEKAIDWAFEIGYRHFDTAKLYNNEEEIGVALSKYSRGEFFLTTKIWPSDFGYEKTLKAFEGNLERLQFDYVDQLLIHWPKEKQKTLETWEALLKIYSEKKARSIGVSNFSIADLNRLDEAGESVPATNQIKFTPGLVNKQLIDYCANKKIQIVAYSPLNQGNGLHDKKLSILAKKYNKTVAQLILRWNVQMGVVIIPKSTKKERLLENASIFDFSISEEDMGLISRSGF